MQSRKRRRNTGWDAAQQRRAQVDAFAKAHPDFDRLAPHIEHLIRVTGQDLELCYPLAVMLEPHMPPSRR
jgi:hypothetical protein